MKITEELLKTIYSRVNEYCIAKYGSTPEHIELCNGFIQIGLINDGSSYLHVSCRYVTLEDLTEDLDSLKAKRLEEELERKRKMDEAAVKAREIALENRRLKYEELKKEFG